MNQIKNKLKSNHFPQMHSHLKHEHSIPIHAIHHPHADHSITQLTYHSESDHKIPSSSSVLVQPSLPPHPPPITPHQTNTNRQTLRSHPHKFKTFPHLTPLIFNTIIKNGQRVKNRENEQLHGRNVSHRDNEQIQTAFFIPKVTLLENMEKSVKFGKFKKVKLKNFKSEEGEKVLVNGEGRNGKHFHKASYDDLGKNNQSIEMEDNQNQMYYGPWDPGDSSSPPEELYKYIHKFKSIQ
jgi:hypothetical protein